MSTESITQKYLYECFDYNSTSGELMWKHRNLCDFKSKVAFKIWNTRYSNKIAGSKKNHGYVAIKINNNRKNNNKKRNNSTIYINIIKT